MLKVRLPLQSRVSIGNRQIVIVGGGFTGATLALLLARRSRGQGDAITVFEPRQTLGTGAAYDTADPDLRLNVASHRMRAVPGNPGAFHAWLKSTGRLEGDPQALQGGMVYARRRDFGAFMQAQLEPELRDGSITHLQRSVVAIGRDHGRWRITDSTGATYPADVVVIATSNPPACLPLDEGAGDIVSQSSETSRIGLDDSVVLAGCGLTAMDMLSALHRRGHRGAITMISRTGLLPRRQPDGDFTAHGESLFRDQRKAASLLRAVRRAVDRVTGDGLPWQSVMDAVRHQAPDLWLSMSVPERLRVKRHLLRWYEVHRHRMAPAMADIVQSLQAAGQLAILAGDIRAVRPQEKGVALTMVARRTSEPREILADHLLVATGPDYANVMDHHAYLRSLHEAGFIKPDPCGFGLACDAESRALAQDGHPVADLYVAGPLARGTFGELTAVPELGAQAEQIARRILTSPSQSTRTFFIRSLPVVEKGHDLCR